MNFLTNIKKTDGNLQKLRDSFLKDLFEERTAYTSTHRIFENRVLKTFYIKDLRTGKTVERISSYNQSGVVETARSRVFSLETKKEVFIGSTKNIFENL